jgi:hypothetical protein
MLRPRENGVNDIEVNRNRWQREPCRREAGRLVKGDGNGRMAFGYGNLASEKLSCDKED